MRALILNAENKTASVQETVRPQPGSGEVLVRVHSVALNPVDALCVFNPIGKTGRVVGADFAGTVVESDSSTIKPGQRVGGFVQGANSLNDRPGAFAEYVVSPSDLVWVVPDSMTFDQAAAVSLCALTAAQALFHRLGLPSPFEWSNKSTDEAASTITGDLTFFVYGASTSVGLYAAQLLRAACEAKGIRLRLIGAASKKHFSMLKAAPYGYDALVDYRDPNWMEQTRQAAGSNGIRYSIDCISEGETVKQVVGVLTQGSKLAIVRSLEGGAWSSEGVDLNSLFYGAVWEGLGVDIAYENMVVPATKDSRSFAVAFYRWLSSSAALEANPIRLMPGGLDRIVADGFALLGPGSMTDRVQGRTESWMQPVRGEKLVYRV
ncbi:chaperonin 10-like protein [Podospora aff. communis PSN243]|uniref:Chaperonin 10-like protein n=1 Tax=Podospora aff. communis PSN243 TaxID=3040156 RepID=A0AAV9GZF3_9PEZI|nr:chaperonin 10-like protein [Podospora aff. communis PSN243]